MRSVLLTGVCVLLVGLSQSAHADQDHGVYVGAGAGQIKEAGNDGNSTSYQAFLGASFSRFAGIELTYIDGGDLSGGVYDPYSGALALGEVSTRAGQISLLGRVPLSRYFAVFGRIAGIYWREDLSVGAYGPYGSYAFSGSDTGTAFGWGAGGEASFGHFALRAEFEQAEIRSVRYQMITGNLIYRF